MMRLNSASEVWWGKVAENQHCDEAWRHARPIADGLTQQLNLLQICEASRRCQQRPAAGPRHDVPAAALPRFVSLRFSSFQSMPEL